MARGVYIIVCTGMLLWGCRTPKTATERISDVNHKAKISQTFQYPVHDVSEIIKNLYTDVLEKTDFVDTFTLSRTEKLYKLTNFRPLWSSDSLIIQALTLLNNSTNHGLNVFDYKISIIDSLNSIRKTDSSKTAINHALLDIRVTDGILLFCKHLYSGKLNARDYHSSWNFINKPELNIDSLLLNFVQSNQIIEIEEFFKPKSNAYTELQKELIKYKKMLSHDTVTHTLKYPDFIIQKGDSNRYVYKLKQQLSIKGFYVVDSASLEFNVDLENSIKRFQQKHGLKPDGLPGKKTYEALNWSITKYIETIQVNLERLRWLPNEVPITYIEINIPEYQLNLFTKKALIYSTEVIVGKYKNQTPVLTSKINYLVFNPCWTVPHSIASEKILPRLKKDTTYLDNRNMFITLNGEKQNHHEIDFSQCSKNNFPYKIFQNSDPNNALGKVKFMFPNNYTIYLHDTPGKSLFTRDHRAFSHGCVRIKDAEHLAEIIVSEVDKNTKPLSYYYNKGYPEKVYLKSEIPLYLKYLTCNYNPKLKQVQFYKDIYALDYKVLKDLVKVF